MPGRLFEDIPVFQWHFSSDAWQLAQTIGSRMEGSSSGFSGGAGATITGSTMTVEGCGSDSLQGDVRFAEVMGLMGAQVQWQPFSITITGASYRSLSV